MNSAEHQAKSPSTRTGHFAALVRLSGDQGSRTTAHRCFTLALALVLFVLVPAGSASAAVVHPHLETFGSTTHPSFTTPESIAVDQSTGDLLVVDAGTETLSRFKPNGEPAPFSALATNVIDAKEGAGGKSCAEEPSSCDKTPQNGFSFGSAAQVQISVDNSGGSDNGDIYVTQASQKLIDVFASSGQYLGQITQYRNAFEEQKFTFTEFEAGDKFTVGNLPAGCSSSSVEVEYKTGGTGKTNIVNALAGACGGSSNFQGIGTPPNGPTIAFMGQFMNQQLGSLTCSKVTSKKAGASCSVTIAHNGLEPVAIGEACGLGVDPAGNLYTAVRSDPTAQGEPVLIHKFAPTHNPPAATDNTTSFTATGVSLPCSIAAGGAATNGFVFVGAENGAISKLNGTTGAIQYTVASGSNTTQTVNQSNGNVLAASGSVVTEYNASGSTAAEVTKESTLTASSAIQGVAVNETTGDVYVSRSSNANIEVFGPPVHTPTVVTAAASGIGPGEATLNGTVNPEGNAITECKFEYGTTAAYGSTASCEGTLTADSSVHPVTAKLTGLEPEKTYYYRLVASNAAGPGEGLGKTLSTSAPVITEPASAITATAATLNGAVYPDGRALTECKFEYGPTAAYGSSKACSQAVGSIEANYQFHSVNVTLTELTKNATYHFRLVVANAAGTFRGEDRTLTTLGPPQVSEELPSWVEEEAATLRAKIDPSGFATNYRFEWGTTASYGNRAPVELEPAIGSGTSPVPVIVHLSGLQPGTHYHFRVVAANSSGTTEGPDQEFETLDSCGLIEHRCYELVSPADKGPVAVTEGSGLEVGFQFQAASEGGKAAFDLLNGLPSATAGNEVIYQASRGEAGWSSTQISPPALVPSQQPSGANPGFVLGLSKNLSCGVVESPEPLTADAPTAPMEAGSANLFRRGEDGVYRVITSLPPVNPEAASSGVGLAYTLIGMSQDCDRVVFETHFIYPGISGVGSERFYEWDDGVLRSVGIIPKNATETTAAEVAIERWNAVSEDASRVFFTAKSQFGGDSGKKALFVRIDGAKTLDVSQSETATADTGATYQDASTDGSRVFFTANSGLTASSSSTGTDLYECRIVEEAGEKFRCELTDLSVDHGSGGAEVAGVLGASEDGSYVYFAAKGQLVAGEGSTFAENSSASTYNVYMAHGGSLWFVGSVRAADLSATVGAAGVLTADGNRWTSRVSTDGKHLLFASTADVTGYESGGAIEAYLYSAESEATVCVSCRPDGSASVAGSRFVPLISTIGSNAPLDPPVTISPDGTRVFFYAKDVLAPGAVEGRVNLYEWERGQVSLLATEPAGSLPESQPKLLFAGSSIDGEDAYFITPAQMNSEDSDGRADLYDARVNGGFPAPAAPLASCDPLTEGSCGQGSPGAPAQTVPATPTFTGPGNEQPQASPKKHKKHRTKKKHHKKKGKGKKHKADKRDADQDRRAAK